MLLCAKHRHRIWLISMRSNYSIIHYVNKEMMRMGRAMFSDKDTECEEAKLAYLGLYSLRKRNKMSCQQIPLTNLPQCPIYASVNWVSIGSDNGLTPVRRQVITWTNTALLSIGPLGTNFSEIWIKTQNVSFTKIQLKISPAKWRPYCPGEMN